jgi:hypothetical protein
MNERSVGNRARARMAAWWRVLRAEPGRAPVRAMTAFCLVLGIWLRARGFLYDVPAMGLDESSWGMMLVDLPLRELSIRPPGFMAVSKVLAHLFGPTETALRTLPWLGGLAVLGLSPFLAKRLFRADAARLLFVAVLATHPGLTDLPKEFKPYALSVALHMALIYFALGYLAERSRRDLAWLLGLSAVGILFTQDLVFAYPGVFAAIGLYAFRNDRRRLAVIAGTALVIVGALALQYFLIWSKLSKGEAEYWGNKYNVFFVPSPDESYGEWLLGRYLRLAISPSYQRTYWNAEWIPGDEWPNLSQVAGDVWFVLHAVGLLVLALRRRFRELVLLALPLAVVVVFNRFGFWPFGLFRTNTFLVPYFTGIAAAALDGNFRRRPVWDLVPASLLVVIPLFFFERDFPPPTKRAFARTSAYPELLRWLASLEPKPESEPRQIVVLTHGTCEPWDFYLKYHPHGKPFRKPIEARFEARCPTDEAALDEVRRAALAPGGRSVWVVRGVRSPFGSPPELTKIQTMRFDRHLLVEWGVKVPRKGRPKPVEAPSVEDDEVTTVEPEETGRKKRRKR